MLISMVLTSILRVFSMRPGKLVYIGFSSKILTRDARRTYRDYVNDTGQDVAVEAGPNGPENVREI